ncbi:aldo/keto reductase [Actinokineospora sp. NBRC 105648]|uniref:aldo/keto reductase n=1 Tax=Actinokineospora sp. NBRC 105648 TaxID=3032206 RepID=UPI0024A5E76D|nr:aldo/keto reductase [Actinokineospora sp. NBRC 105648]GLZ41358.1 aldo/keto reductase [Actinokineospora sp. NBRC 105648]
MTVPRRKIGADGPEVSVLSMGSWHIYDRMPFQEAVQMVRRAVDAGVNLFDVGYYGGFTIDGKTVQESYTDIIFGRAVAVAGIPRADWLLSVKLWIQAFPEVSFADQLDPLLARVGVEHADYTVLGDLFGTTPDMTALTRGLGDLIESGKLGGWGVNNWSVDDIRAAHDAAAAQGIPGPSMAQLKYSVVRRSIPDGEPFRRLADDIGITIQASDVFEGGILAGNLVPDRMVGRDPGGIREQVADAAVKLAAIAEGFDATAAQAGIAFCLADPLVSTVLFGTSRLAQLEANLGAVELAEKHGAEIRAAVADLWLDRDVVDPTGH